MIVLCHTADDVQRTTGSQRRHVDFTLLVDGTALAENGAQDGAALVERRQKIRQNLIVKGRRQQSPPRFPFGT